MFFSADAPVCACVHQRYSSKATLYLYVIYEATFIIKQMFMSHNQSLKVCFLWIAETVVKTVRRQPDVTPVCMSKNLGVTILVRCRISTERHRGEKFCLFYMPGKQFDQECDSRFTLINKNRTVFIHLESLTSVDSGNYICECSYERGTRITHLKITVEGEFIC